MFTSAGCALVLSDFGGEAKPKQVRNKAVYEFTANLWVTASFVDDEELEERGKNKFLISS